MELYLSSYRLGKEEAKLAEMVGNGNKIAVIGNAMDFVDDELRKKKINENFEELKRIGLDPVEIDLRLYFDKPKELAEKMSEFKAVYVRGGNVFVLRRAFYESGFDKWLMSQKDNASFVYSGYSAGCCVLSPSLKGMEMVDNPNDIGKGYKQEIIWDGLGIINYSFVPHFESDHPESTRVGDEVEFYKKNNIPFKTLHDGEVIITEN
jgi:dipeptidase E